jgi:ATP-dependent exoDNAse (exonuclease V) beta subunit
MVHYSYPDWKAQPWAREISQQFISGQQDEEEVNLDTIAQNIAPLPVSEAPAWKSVTDFIEKQHGAEFAFLPPSIEAGGVSPVDRGSVLHRCLEEFTRRGTYDLDRILKEFPTILSLDHAERQSFDENVRLVLKTVLEASAYAWIFTRREHSYSELPFLYTRGRSFISGIIDRVVIQQDIGFVIDYKAILINTDEDLASWIELYRPQIQIYTEAVKHLFDLKSVEGYLLFLDSNRLQLVVKI